MVIALSCCLVLLLFVVFLLHINKKLDTLASNNDQIATTIETNPVSVAIPGYELLELRANRKKQILCLPNPEHNMCYFQISLYLEDGTLLWQSELIEPGKTSKPIVLTKTLEKGTYSNAVLRYTCSQMDENRTPLNGAETKVTLWVK